MGRWDKKMGSGTVYGKMLLESAIIKKTLKTFKADSCQTVEITCYRTRTSKIAPDTKDEFIHLNGCRSLIGLKKLENREIYIDKLFSI